MNEGRGSWYLLTGLVLGVVMGLVYSWVIAPVEYVDAAPGSLREDFKDQYRALVAAAYVANGDLARAVARLEQLDDPNIARTVAIQAQRSLAEGRPEAEARALGLLAVALGQGPTPVVSLAPITQLDASATSEPIATVSPTPLIALTETPPSLPGDALTPTPTVRTPPPTSTPLPSRTPTPTPGAPFILQDIQLVCNPNLGGALIQVEARDAAGQPVPGVEILVLWDGNEDRFFTGLKPELGLGYADFTMTPGVTYLLRLAEGGQPVPDLTPSECDREDGERYWGSWLLVFVQP